MQPGEMNELITFEQVGHTKNAGGGSVEAWAQLGAKSWAKVKPMSGSEQVRAAQVGSSTMFEVGLYRRTDVNEADRIVRSNGDVLRIRSVLRETNEGFMTVMAEKVTP
ncbi:MULTISPECIES: phage head closure protein [unclassified Thalassospira]|uniref:phage head closure protein n=1 Tax=unclassified Thalassospira TaxID=2648997 RepID=UPI0007A5B0E7|nr:MULTISPECIES: phage head closure protein [unclassified Thalassospira]ONH85379.1 hypothetical protein TH47_05910 [Thalassospira sp. MCCC 1A02803]